MYELIRAAGRSSYIQSPTNIGLYELGDGEVCIIDSGNDASAGRKVRQILDANGWKLRAIYNTHSHADHIGGNGYLQRNTGCKIYAPEYECDFINHTEFGPAIVYGGFPCEQLRHKFLLAEKSEAEVLSGENLPDGFEVIPLPGHTLNMVGYKTPDGAVYLGDSLSSSRTLEKYGICFIYDVWKFLETLEKVMTMQARLFIPSHAEPCEDIAPLAKINIDKVYEIAGQIAEFCKEPTCLDMLLKRLFDRYGLKMSVEQHALVGSTVRSYLSWLGDSGKIERITEDNMILYKSK